MLQMSSKDTFWTDPPDHRNAEYKVTHPLHEQKSDSIPIKIRWSD